MGLLSENIKYCRKKLNYTQQSLADEVGVKRAVIGSYEEDRAEPKTELLLKMASLFEITVDDLISVEINDAYWEKLKKTKNNQMIMNSKLEVLAISVDREGNENVELVPVKASAGYLNGYGDLEYIKELPKLYLPFLRGGTFRAFELNGDSMLPLESGTIVIGEYLENWFSLKKGDTCVFVTKQEGVVYKRINQVSKQNNEIVLSSDNKAYENFNISFDDIIEVWKSKAYISTVFPDPSAEEKTLNNIEKLMMQMLENKSKA